jgi:hypothetical protein
MDVACVAPWTVQWAEEPEAVWLHGVDEWRHPCASLWWSLRASALGNSSLA